MSESFKELRESAAVESHAARARDVDRGAQAFFEFLSSSDRRAPHDIARPESTRLRIAHITDIHIPGEVQLAERLRDFVTHYDSVGELAHKLSAIGNAFAHSYHASRQLYTNVLKKALVGLHKAEVDHLVITGDLAHCGLEPEFLEMRAILKLTGWWGDEKLTVVPGNHDRFNLYEQLARQPMEHFFPIASSRNPEIKTLDGVVLYALESNCDRNDDRHFSEEWLPNTVGRIYPEEYDFVANAHRDNAGRRALVLVHHHITQDWYSSGPESIGGLMNPVDNADHLLEAARLTDPNAVVLHGHKHDVMPVDYTTGPHPVSCPGGFADTLTVTFLDLDLNDEIRRTHARLRV